jgi:hypothetical protein
VVQEINRNWGVDEAYTVENLDPTPFPIGKCVSYWGMSQLAAARLYSSFGYIAVYVDRQAVNMFFVLEDALVAQMHALGATKITRSDVRDMLSPTFEYVYRRQDTTLCARNSFIKFRERDLIRDENKGKRWLRVASDGSVEPPPQ